jgi:hypothetical protein
MTRNRRLVPLLLVLLVSALLAGCGDDDDDTASGSASTPTEDAGGEGEGEGEVTVTMADYAFAASGALSEGGRLRVVNEGDEVHMIAIGKLKDGATLDDLRGALESADPSAEEDPTMEFLESEPEIGWPGGFVTPGNEVTLSASNLSAGNYALLCFIPTEGDGAPHFAKGMLGEMEVVAGEAEAADADVTYEVTAGEPIEGPETLEAGEHTVEIAAAGGGAHEPQLVRAASADQSIDEINELINEKFGAFETEEGPAKGIGKELGELVLFAGFDLGELESVTFTFDFEPGTYYLAAPDTDAEDSEGKVPTELIKITVE